MSIKIHMQGIEVIGKMVTEVIDNEIRAQERKQQILESLVSLMGGEVGPRSCCFHKGI